MAGQEAFGGLAGKTHIGVLRVRAQDPVAARLSLSSRLGGANVRPPFMPPGAVLIVRRMADPLPERIAPAVLGTGINPAWERAVRDALAGFYRKAARPAFGPVPPDADAVLFADRAEMLAHLVNDLLQGCTDRWWWQTLRRGLPTPATTGITVLLCREAAQAPAVLHYLVKHGQATRVMQALSPAQTMAILAAMGRAYEVSVISPEKSSLLPPLIGALSNLLEATPVLSEASETSQLGYSPVPSAPAADVPWQNWLPDNASISELAREQICLLGVGLGLYHAPAVVRSAGFIRKLHNWWLATITPTIQPKPTPPASQSSGRPLPAVSLRHSATPPVEEATPVTLPKQSAIAAKPMRPSVQPVTEVQRFTDEYKPVPDQILSRSVAYSEKSQSSEPATSINSISGEARPALALAPQAVEQPPLAREEIAAAGTKPDSVRIIKGGPSELERDSSETENYQQDERIETAWRLANGVTTRLGSVLHLINLMAYLDLPDCFEDEWRLATRLGAWGTLEALARALLADSDSALVEDSLWLALAELSGRKLGEVLGADLPENPDFRLPVAWSSQVDNSDQDAYAWDSNGHRLRLWSEQGYLLVEVTCGPLEPASQAAAELRRYRGDAPFQLYRQRFDDAPLAGLDGPLTTGLSPSLRRWLERVIPYLRWRLRRALSDDVADDPREWLCQPGQLYVTSTHVDLVLSLNAVSIPIRLAGLDRDPGWLPEFSRVIKSYFE